MKKTDIKRFRETASRHEFLMDLCSFRTCPIIVSLYCFFCVTLMGGSFVTADTKKFMRMSSQLASWSTMFFRLLGRKWVYR